MTPPAPEPGHGRNRASDDQDHAADGPEERDPGLALERTSLAWTRTAISFAALGGVVLKVNVITGLIIMAIAPVIWRLGLVTRGDAPVMRHFGRVTRGAPENDRPSPGLPVVGANRLFLIAATIVAVALLCLIVAILGRSVPGALRLVLSHGSATQAADGRAARPRAASRGRLVPGDLARRPRIRA